MAESLTATAKIKIGTEGADQVGGAADRVQQLQRALLANQSALNEHQKAMRMVKGTASAEEFGKMADKARMLRATIGADALELHKFGAAMRESKAVASPIAPQASGVLDEFADKLGVSKLAALSMVGAVTAVGGAAIELVGNLASAVRGLFAFAAAAAEASRSQRLLLEGMIAARGPLVRDGQAMASGLQDAIRSVSANVPIATEQVAGMAKELWGARFRGERLTTALKQMGEYASATGDSSLAGFLAMRGGMNGFGESTAIAKERMKAFHDIAVRQMLSLDVIQRKAKESFAALFSDLDLLPFANGLTKILNLFSQNTAEGYALKQAFEGAFGPILAQGELIGTVLKPILQGVIIGALTFVLALLKVRTAIKSMLPADALGTFDAFGVSMTVASVTLFGLAFAASAVAAAVVALGVALAVAAAPFILLGGTAYNLYQAFQRLRELDLTAIGVSLMKGLANGIRAGVGAVLDEVSSLGSAIEAKLRNALDIHSPSRLTFGFGSMLAEGLGAGMREGTPRVSMAAGEMAQAVPAGLRAMPVTAGAEGGAPGRSVVVNFTYTGPTELPPDFEPRVRGVLTNALEMNLVEMGAPA